MRVKLDKDYKVYSSHHGNFTPVETEVCNISVRKDAFGTTIFIHTKFGTPQDGMYYLESYEFRQALREGSLKIIK